MIYSMFDTVSLMMDSHIWYSIVKDTLFFSRCDKVYYSEEENF